MKSGKPRARADRDAVADASDAAGLEAQADDVVDDAIPDALIDTADVFDDQESDGDDDSADEAKAMQASIAEEAGHDSTQAYLRNIGTRALLTPEEELRTATLAAAGDFAARQTMIEHNLRLVVSIAKHFLNRGVALPDLIEEGNLGLIHALTKFDPSRGFRFSTYATWWIRQSVERAVINQSRTVRLPVHVVRDLNQVLRARRHLEQAVRAWHGSDERSRPNGEPAPEVTHEAIGHLIGKSGGEVADMLALSEHTASLDAPMDFDPTISLGDTLADTDGETPETFTLGHEVEHLVHGWMERLTERQRYVIERRFGLNDLEARTLDDIAEELSLTRERVRQIQQEALLKLKRTLAIKGVEKDSLL